MARPEWEEVVERMLLPTLDLADRLARLTGLPVAEGRIGTQARPNGPLYQTFAGGKILVEGAEQPFSPATTSDSDGVNSTLVAIQQEAARRKATRIWVRCPLYRLDRSNGSCFWARVAIE